MTKTQTLSNEKVALWTAQGAMPRKVKVIGKTFGKSVEGEVFIRTLNPKDRLKRALRILGIGWGFAICSVFIPLLHFILVPGFLLGTVVVAWHFYQQEATRLGGIATCPKCGEAFSIIAGKVVWPIHDVCAACQEHVEIQRADS